MSEARFSIQQRGLSLLVIASDEQNARRFDFSHVAAAETHLIINYAQEPLAKIANRFLLDCNARVFGLCHADVYFGPGALDTICQTCIEENAVCGIVGFSMEAVDRKAPKGGYVFGQENPGPVETLDSASCFFPVLDNALGFDDQTFDGFHCHVEDLCLSALSKGMKVLVPGCDVKHLSSDRNDWMDSWHEDFRRYKAKLESKWAGVRFGTT